MKFSFRSLPLALRSRLNSCVRLARASSFMGFAFAASLATTSCLQRPICAEDEAGTGGCQPKTTSVVVDQLVQDRVDKIDLLFVIDNSASMADKQEILSLALPDLIDRLVSPICVDSAGKLVLHPPSATEECPSSSAREFQPVQDIHVGVITSSLGAPGNPSCGSGDEPRPEHKVDMAHLLGSLDRGRAAIGQDFLRWTAAGNARGFSGQFQKLVQTSDEFGCGWEATLEAWYRFLIDPAPYRELERVNCPFGNDTEKSCFGPTTDPSTLAPLVDEVLLQQRAEFLRPDSLVAVVMLSDENDCSFRASGQSWLLTQPTPARKGTAACATNPNDPCCQSCGAKEVPAGCATEPDSDGKQVGKGCGMGSHLDPTLDSPNLRCFQQKQRFGLDLLYPVERYARALAAPEICPQADDLDPEACAPGERVRNPLFDDLSLAERRLTNPDAVAIGPRSPSLVFLAGIVGVPWQDLTSPSINWDWLIGERHPTNGIPEPLDPLMKESVEPRSGLNPATMENVAGVSARPMENSINGHEWNISGRSDLQYACIFPLLAPKQCPAEEQVGAPNCDCSAYGEDPTAPAGFNNPLCQAEDGSYDRTQRYAKAYPSLRQLQVLHDFGENSIVASICPKQTRDPDAADFGYRPAVAEIVERLKAGLAEKCLHRDLAVREDGSASCIVVEATPPELATEPTCESVSSARASVTPQVAKEVLRKMEAGGRCGGAGQPACESYRLCEIKQLLASSDPVGLDSCLNDPIATSGDGWCYVDPPKAGSEAVVKNCGPTEKRKLRFVGKGTPLNKTVTVVVCAGAVY